MTNTATETEEVKHLSKRQLKTIWEIPKAKQDIHCGPYGCGKTYSVDIGIGQFAMMHKPPRDGSVILLVGKTAQAVKMNICNVLSAKYGSNFRYDTGKKDGFTKDAVLFGHLIRIVGLNDANAEERIRGINAYKIFADEVSTWSEENYDKVYARLRGSKPEGTEFGLIGTTNPDSPTHWLWKRINQPDSPIRYVPWTKHDRPGKGAEEYYAGLEQQYAYNEAYLQRYVYGKWTAAEGLVYTEFMEKLHVYSPEELEGLEFAYYKIGVDFGTKNPTAILVIGVDRSGINVVIDEYYKSGATLTDVVAEIIKFQVKYYDKFDKVYIDPAAQVLITQLNSDKARNIQGANNSVMDGINYVKDQFTYNKLIISSKCTNLINELYTYAFSKKEGENVEKKNDHACDALRYALYTPSRR